MSNALRQNIEQNVLCYNKELKDVVKKMDMIILLRNAHPVDRSVFTFACLREKMINKEQAKEFVKIIGG